MNTNITSLTETPTILTVRSNQVGRHRWLCANAGSEDIILHSEHHSRVVKRIAINQEWMQLAAIQPRKHNGKLVGGQHVSQSSLREWLNSPNHPKEKVGQDWLILSFIDLASCQFNEVNGFTVENQNGLGLSVWKTYEKGNTSWAYKWYEITSAKRAEEIPYTGPTFATTTEPTQPTATTDHTDELFEPNPQVRHYAACHAQAMRREIIKLK